MRLILSTLITIIFWIGVTAQTPVPPGPVSGTWAVGGSPYLLEGINTIEDGTTLTIEPGVEVRWLNDNCPMYVNGRILAIGTESDSITFTRDVPNASFGSIRFYSTPNTNDSSIFKYCLFEHGKVFGDIPDNCGGAIASFEFDKVIIDHCSFFDNKAVDVSIYTIPLGGAIALRNASPSIRNCIFKNNSCYAGGAIGLFLNSDPEIKNNTQPCSSRKRHNPGTENMADDAQVNAANAACQAHAEYRPNQGVCS